MREIKRKGNQAKCPYCGFVCRLDDEVDQCEHLYEVIAFPDNDPDHVFYYFVNHAI